MMPGRILKLLGGALAAIGMIVPLCEAGASASDDTSQSAPVERVEIEISAETARAVAALREFAAISLDASSAQQVAHWEYVSQHSRDIEQRLEAQNQAARHGLRGLATELWEGTAALVAQYASLGWNDPTPLLGAMATADQLGMNPEAAVMWQMFVVLMGQKAAMTQAVRAEPAGQTNAANATASAGSSDSTNENGASNHGGPGHPGDLFGSGHGGSDHGGSDHSGSTAGSTSTDSSGIPSDATRIAYTVETKSEGTTDAGGTTTKEMYVSSETYSYTGDDGREHERTITYDEDGAVTSVVDQVVDDDTTDARCAEDGCGNPDTGTSDAPSTAPPACQVDACNTGGDVPAGVDPTTEASPVPASCDPAGYHDGDCAPVEILAVPELSPSTGPQSCAADGCPHPDLAPPPHDDVVDIPSSDPYARPA